MDKILTIMASALTAGDNSGSDLTTILYAVLNTILGLAFVVIVIGAIRAAIALSHATDDMEGAKAKKRLTNCIIACVVCAVALGVANAVLATAST
jgi:uncharacterized membrane protein YiaA